MSRNYRRWTLPFLLLFTFLSIPMPARADGIIVPHPPPCDPVPCEEPISMAQLAIPYHRVSIQIDGSVSVTRVEQAFRNDNDWVVEGTYFFPIPEGASLSNFELWMEGEPIKGKILTVDEARRIYEKIIRDLRDPALLEYIDRGAVQVSIFPIQPGETRKISLEYTEILQKDNGLYHYRYPLNTEKFSTLPLEEVVITFDIESQQAINAVYSSSHPIDILREGPRRVKGGFEARNLRPEEDFDLFFTMSQDEVSLNLLAYRDPYSSDPNGFFLLLAAPNIETPVDHAVPRDILLVLDQSGSMEGEKFRQAQTALSYILQHLNPRDRFNVIAFSTGVQSFRNGLQSVDQTEAAQAWVESLAPRGSTDIHKALVEAVDQLEGDRQSTILFLTDGLPTQGITDTNQILKAVQALAPEDLRLFAFGVGYDVDTFLLDSLVNQHHGLSGYVLPDEPIDRVVTGFYEKVSTPVLTDLRLEFDGAIAYDSYPSPLPDLFAGHQLIAVGRYRGYGITDVSLSGEVNGNPQRYLLRNVLLPESGGSDFIPRLWATRKIGWLLNQNRLQGPDQELIEQIVQLSIRYGVITPYTSFLVTEEEVFSSTDQEELSDRIFSELSDSQAPSFGQAAVEQAAGEGVVRFAEVPQAIPAEAESQVKVVGSKVFKLTEGKWIDTSFDPNLQEPMRVAFLSEDYFRLAGSDPEVGAALALGTRVILLYAGQAYEVVPQGEHGDPIQIPEVQKGPDAPERSDEPSQPVNRGLSPFPCAPLLLVLPILALLGFCRNTFK